MHTGPRRYLRRLGHGGPHCGAGSATRLAALLLTAGATGAAYEAIASRSDRSVQPAGKLVDIGGYRLHITCTGQGSPTVILDAGLGGSSLDWMLVQPALAKITRVCAYDRAGMGSSDPGPLPRSQAQIAGELHRLLHDGAIPGPYILVAHSLTGKAARLFAAARPDEVVGMVLVDARSEDIDAQMSKAESDQFDTMLSRQAKIYWVARRLGLARLFGAGLVDQPLLPARSATELVLAQTQPAALDAMLQEGLSRSVNDDALAHLPPLSQPLVVLAAGESMAGIPQWAEAQKHLAASGTPGQLVIAQGSSHYIQLDDPALVIASIGRSWQQPLASKIGKVQCKGPAPPFAGPLHVWITDDRLRHLPLPRVQHRPPSGVDDPVCSARPSAWTIERQPVWHSWRRLDVTPRGEKEAAL